LRRCASPELAKYKGAAVNLTEIWIATRVALRNVLENVSLQDILDGKYEKQIVNLISTKDAWKRRVN
jgi:DNA-binding IscR family transcriptional regulator